MEAYLRQAGPLEERFEGAVHEILGINRGSDSSGKDQSVVFVKARKPHPLFELALAVRLENVHSPGGEVDLAPPSPGLGLTHGVPAAFAHQGTPHAQRPALQ